MKEYLVGDYIKDEQGHIFFVIASFSAINDSKSFRCLLVLDKSLIVTSYNLIKFSNEKEYFTGSPCRYIYLHTYGIYCRYASCMLGEDFTLANKEESRNLQDKISCLPDDHKKRLVKDVEGLLSVIIKDNRKLRIYKTYGDRRGGMFAKYPPFRKILVSLISEYLNPDKHIEIANL